MGLKVSDVKREERTTTISFTQGDLTVTYRPNIYTPALVADMTALQQDPDNADDEAVRDGMDSFVQSMANLLVSWDLVGEDGDVVPIDPDSHAFRDTPFKVFQVVMTHIGEENRPEARRRSRGG